LLEGERTFDAGESWPTTGEGRSQLARRLRAWRPEVALVLPFSFSSARFALTTGAKVRLGYGHELRSFMLTDPQRRVARGELHLSREYLALGELLGVRPAPLPALATTDAGRAAALALLSRAAPGR